MNDYTVVIVTYNSGKFIDKCLHSIINGSERLREVIVIDNASTDKTVDIVTRYLKKYNNVRLIRLKKNIGFPLANNIGVLISKTKYVALVNPDVEVEPGSLDILASYLDNDENVAVVQPKIVHPNNRIDSVGGVIDILGHGIHLGKNETDRNQYNKDVDILYATFACAMVRRDLYLRVGGMNPHFFLYNEDLDFCWRLINMGYKIRVVPESRVIHFGQHSTRKMSIVAKYFSRRNRLISNLINFSLIFALFSVAVLAALYTLLIPILHVRGRKSEARAMLKIYNYVLKHIKGIMQYRVLVNKNRKIGDIELIKQGLIIPKPMGIILYLVESLFFR